MTLIEGNDMMLGFEVSERSISRCMKRAPRNSNNSRILEVDAADNVVSTYYTNTRPGSISMPLPTRAVRLKNGNTLISDQFNHQVIEIDPSQNIVWSQGMIGVSGTGFNLKRAL
jgi:hypothetical protein